MNLLNTFFLALVLAPQKFYAGLGINVSQLRSILQIKLLMDDRRPNALRLNRQTGRDEKPATLATVFMMFFSLLIGLMYLFAFNISDNFAVQTALYFAFFMGMLTLMLIGDFTSVLIDVRDNLIILPKPVNDRTMLASRLLHILIHVSKMLLPMSLPGIIYVLVNRGPSAGGLFTVLVMLASLLSIFFINALYILVLRVTTPERFKNIISYLQIFFTIVIYAGMQLLPRMLARTGFDLDFITGGWWLLLPPTWFGCAYLSLLEGGASTAQWAATAAAFLVPFLTIWVVVKYLAPAFNRKLAMISGSGERLFAANAATTVRSGGGRLEKLAALVCSGKAEKVGFLFSWKMMARSREFKLKVYPQIGYLFVLAVVFVFTSNDRSGLFREGFGSVTIVYFSSVLIINAIANIIYSAQYKAAWLFHVTPLEQPGLIINGAVKALILQFFGVLMPFVLLYGLWSGGFSQLPNFFLAVCNQLLITYLIALLTLKQLPFSQAPDNSRKGENFAMSFIIMFVTSLLGMLHYLFFHHIYLILGATFVSLFALNRIMARVRDIQWEKIKASGAEF